jgi:hypothetical protein
MTVGFKAFMNDLIDYAGLFPPAKLPFQQAVSEYLQHQQEKQAWMLARFICPSSQVSGFGSFRDQLSHASAPLCLSILLTEIGMTNGTSSKIAQSIRQVKDLLINMSIEYSMEMVECKLSEDFLQRNGSSEIGKFLDELEQSWSKYNLNTIPVFFEPTRDHRWPEVIPRFLESMAMWSEKRKSGSSFVPGFKLRCGGDTSEAFPSIEEVSMAIYYGSQYAVPFKATAGLHHPVRHFHQPLHTHRHGFFNIFGAALLAYGHRLPFTEIRKIVSEEDSSSFRFDEDGFRWQDLKLESDKITSLRQNKILSFGSCSFAEPREDLQKLGLL